MRQAQADAEAPHADAGGCRRGDRGAGLCETRIADVAERAGLSPALVVYYFGSKEKLLTEALAYAEDLFYIELSGS